MLDVIEDLNEHFIFGDMFGMRAGIIVGAVVNNAVHIKVEVVELGNAVLSDELRDRRVALGEPSEELGNT